MTAAAEQIGNWLELFTRQERADPWLEKLREDAFARFTELGFPATRDEDWRFTNLAPIARAKFAGQAADAPDQIEIARLSEADRAQLGKYAPQTAFVALNTAFLKGVAFAKIGRGALVEQPVAITQSAPPAQAGGLPHAHPRTLILVAPGAQCTIIETYQGEGQYLTNAVTEIAAGEGAVVDHYKVQMESADAFHIATMQVSLGRSANFSTHNISLGGALTRNDIGVRLAEGAEATVNGLYLVNGTQHVDNHTEIDHAEPHGTSHELYKGILDGRASAVFNGRIIVRKDAQKTDSKQTNKNLVLSDDAVIDTKPELQILADDVRCTHGATIGQLDAESLFYLQSRGIGRVEARSLLTQAFAQDIIDRIKVPELREQLERALAGKFHERTNR